MVIYIKLFLTAVLFGGTFIAGRLAAQHVGPYSASFLRFAVASFFLVLFAGLTTGKKLPRLRKNRIISIILLGLTGVFAYNVFFFSGLKTISASRASLIIAVNPVFIALFAAAFFKEKLNIKNYVGILLCTSGAIVVISKGNPLIILQGGVGSGELYILGCVACWVAYSLIGKTALQDISPLSAVTYSCIIGDLFLFFPACSEGMFRDLAGYSSTDWLSIFYLGFFGSVIGFTWFYEGIKKIGASRAGNFINFVPIAAVILAYFILGEKLDWSLISGAVIVISGAYLTNKKG